MNENYKIVEISEKGRGIVAEKSFDEGEILFDEVPLCSAQFSWGRHLGYKSCFHCFRPLEAPNEAIRRLTKNEIETLPDEFGEMAKNKIEICRKTEMEFCSEECAKDADYLYMKLLNENWKSVLELDEFWRDIHFPPETATIMLIIKLLAMKRIDESLSKSMDELVCESENENFGHKILGEKFENTLTLVTQGLQKIIPDVTDEETLTIFALCGRNQQGIGISPLSKFFADCEDEEYVDMIYDTIEKVTGIDFMDNEGVGIYLKQAMLNHDCHPNAQIKFNSSNHILSVELIRPVEKGDEITISYLDPCQLSDNKLSRQDYLKENYLFQCNCKRCEEEDTEDEETEPESEQFNPDSFS